MRVHIVISANARGDIFGAKAVSADAQEVLGDACNSVEAALGSVMMELHRRAADGEEIAVLSINSRS